MKIRFADGSGDINLRYLLEEILPSGRTRIRFRRKGRQPITLHAPIGTEEFLAEYRAAMNGETKPRQDGRPRRVPAKSGSLRWFIEQYYGSAEFKTLETRTQHVRRLILDDICAEPVVPGEPATIGDQPFARFDAKHIRKLRDRKLDRPEAANSRVKALRQIFASAITNDLHDRNPARDVAYIKTGSMGHHTWTIDEVRQYEERHPIGTKARLAMALLLFLGGRRSDVVAFGRQHIRNPEDMAADLRALHPGRWLRYTQQKNRRRKPISLEIPILPALEEIIAASPCGDLTFLVTQFGKSFAPAGFGNWFADQCREAGVPGRAHGLRKAGATIAAENGATAHQLMNIFGWRTLKQAEVYTRAAEQKRLAGSAMSLIDLGRRTGNAK